LSPPLDWIVEVGCVVDEAAAEVIDEAEPDAIEVNEEEGIMAKEEVEEEGSV